MPMQSKAILIQRGTELVGVGPNGKAEAASRGPPAMP